MILCAPVTSEGLIDPSWGSADQAAVAEVVDDEIANWLQVEVSWSRLHDEGTPGSHHARIVKFLREHQVEAVVANHIGDGMRRMLDTMGLPVHLGATGDAHRASTTSRPRPPGAAASPRVSRSSTHTCAQRPHPTHWLGSTARPSRTRRSSGSPFTPGSRPTRNAWVGHPLTQA